MHGIGSKRKDGVTPNDEDWAEICDLMDRGLGTYDIIDPSEEHDFDWALRLYRQWCDEEYLMLPDAQGGSGT